MKKYYFIALISTILALSGCEQHRFQDIDSGNHSGWIIYLDANGGNFSHSWNDKMAPIVLASIDDIYNNNYYWDWDTIPVRSGYYFDGWSQSKNGTDGLSLKKMTFSSPVDTIYAVWKEAKFVSKPFSVSSSKKVYFSAGNLQYHPANNKWRFAESQLDYIGDNNYYISSYYNGWIDLFGWSTSDTYFGVSTSTSDYDYYGSFVDWGKNKIGTDAANTWRTLTDSEWRYILQNRYKASSLRGVAEVDGVNGLILLPDNWVCPSGITFKSGFYSYSGSYYYEDHQTFTKSQWAQLESAGAIFLPAGGYRSGSYANSVRNTGGYWSSTSYSTYYSYYLYFYSDRSSIDYDGRHYGYSVRLVKDL